MTDQVLLDAIPRIDLADLIEDLKEKDRRSLSEAIEAYQENLLDELCGKKRKPNQIYRRAGSNRRPKTIMTPLGMVQFKTWKVENHATGETLTPILDILDVRGRKYTRQVKAQCAELTSKLSYGDTSEEYHRLTGVWIPKSTIHAFTQELAPGMLQTQLNIQPQPEGLAVVQADATEVRAIKTGEFNQVHVTLSVSPTSKQLLGLTVNKPYTGIPSGSILISDGDPALKNQEPWRHQLCILHAIKRLTYALWREHASKIEREYLKAELEHILYTLINSTRRHASDGDHEALTRRIESTLRELSILAARLKRRGYREASEFIAKNGKLLVTFAELTLEGIRIPYTTNQIERLMGEIAKRCKHRWAHWSDEGLKNILTLILIHYTNPTLYEQYWQTYIHQGPTKARTLTTQI
jgi:hypothetical protein